MTATPQTAPPAPAAQPVQSPVDPWAQQNQDVSIIFDLFPANVDIPGQSFSKVRATFVYAPMPMLYIWSDGPRGPGLLFSAPYDPNHIYGDNASGFDVYAGLDPAAPTIASVVSVRPHGNCGCGSRLKTLRPFSTMRHTAAPASAGPLPAPPVITPAP